MSRLLNAIVGLALSGPALAQGNVLLVMADDFGIDNIEAYGVGSAPTPTPTLDGLMAAGVTFTNAWSNPLCSPTRAAMQTGRYSIRTGIGDLVQLTGPALALAEVTLAEMLAGSPADWDVALLGKWHLGNVTVGGNLNPNLQGYPHFAGTIEGAVRDYYDWDKITNGVFSTTTKYTTTDTVDDALAWLDTADEPFFLTVSFHAPHGPFHAPPANLHTKDLDGLDPLVTPRPFYEAMIQAMDAELGRLLAEMHPSMLARTNVIFLADNGTPEVVAVPPFTPSTVKQSLFQGGIRVPFIVAGPAVTRVGEVEDTFVHVVDVFPTLAQLAQVNPHLMVPPGTVFDGMSLVPFFGFKPLQLWKPVREFVIAERFSPIASPHPTSKGFTIRDTRYKLIRDSTLSGEHFYDLSKDPLELRNYIETGFPTAASFNAYRKLRRELSGIVPFTLP